MAIPINNKTREIVEIARDLAKRVEGLRPENLLVREAQVLIQNGLCAAMLIEDRAINADEARVAFLSEAMVLVSKIERYKRRFL